MAIDEIIAEEIDNAEFSKANKYDKSAYYHNQIAELLEELKAYRENSNGYNKEDIELNRNAMYNKAIDDFVCAVKRRFPNDKNGIFHIELIAEQLKEGGKNE